MLNLFAGYDSRKKPFSIVLIRIALICLMVFPGMGDALAETEVSLTGSRIGPSTLYVETTGNDDPSNYCVDNGNPCLTVAFATSRATDGDTVQIGAGTFNNTNVTCNIDLTYQGSGYDETILDGGGSDRVFYLPNNSKTVDIESLQIRNGSAIYGAGIYSYSDLNLTYVKVLNNTARDHGGGIYLADGEADIEDVEISGNMATIDGGFGSGAGMFILTSDDVDISTTTISGNTAANRSSAIHSQGGGTVNLTNVTISGNTSKNNSAVLNSSLTTINFVNSTIASNQVETGGFNGGIANYATMTFQNSIVADNDDDDCLVNASGTWTSLGNNLSSDGTCSFTQTGDAMNVDVKLLPLADNGGHTKTHALGHKSPALDSASNPACPGTDQRDKARPMDGDRDGTADCDIGAYERSTLMKKNFRSKGEFDGWVLEGSETSNKGATLNSTVGTFNVGDDLKDRQFRGILFFNTSVLPDNVDFAKAVLKVTKKEIIGDDPFNTHGKIALDIREGTFSNNKALEVEDFEATPDKSKAGSIRNNPSGDSYKSNLSTDAFPYINLTGKTQLRLRFLKDDNDDMAGDFFKFYSGDHTSKSLHPMLTVLYYEH